MSLLELVPVTFLLVSPLVYAQTATSADATTSSTSNTTGGAGNATASCSWDDSSISDYLKCQKQKISTTTLVASGIGVTVAILALVGAGVWLCNRQRRGRQGMRRKGGLDMGVGDDDNDIEKKAPGWRSADRGPVNSGDDEQYDEDDTRHEVKRSEAFARSQPRHDTHGARSARVESASSSASIATPPPPHPAHLKPSLPSEIVGSPVDEPPSRSLYPSNPSPMPRHMHPGPAGSQSQGQSRMSAYPKRQSMASVHPSSIHDAPPVPTTTTSKTGTPPLNIRKSTIDASLKTRRTEGAIPSYYEATSGQAVATGQAGTTRQLAPGSSSYGRSASVPNDAPPVPPASQRPLDARRPRAPAHVQRKIPERGGLI